MSSWIAISARLAVFPLIVASICVAVPHFVFTRSTIDVPRTMTLIAGVTWGVSGAGFLLLRKWLYLFAFGIATASVLVVWGGHVFLAREAFRMYIGFPTATDYAMASLWWAAYFAALFALLYPLHSGQLFKSATPQESSPHPGMKMAVLFGMVNFGLVVILAVVTASTSSYEFTFPALATLNLPLQTIKDAARPGMGSGGYLPGSMILYAFFGSAFQSTLAWGVCRLGFAVGIVQPHTHKMQNQAMDPSGNGGRGPG